MAGLVVTAPKKRPSGADVPAVLDWLMAAIESLLLWVRGLYSLDANLREQRTIDAERAVLFGSAVVVGAVQRLEDIMPSVKTQNYTTAQIDFDATSGTGRYRIDGGSPAPAIAAASGMVIPGGAFGIVLQGASNIRSFAVTGETAQTLNMSVTLFK